MDTGYDIAAQDWLGEISVMPTPDGLKLIGLDPLDVDMVITSHFHYDHIGYLVSFGRPGGLGPDGVRLLVRQARRQRTRGGVHDGRQPRPRGEGDAGGAARSHLTTRRRCFPA